MKKSGEGRREEQKGGGRGERKEVGVRVEERKEGTKKGGEGKEEEGVKERSGGYEAFRAHLSCLFLRLFLFQFFLRK